MEGGPVTRQKKKTGSLSVPLSPATILLPADIPLASPVAKRQKWLIKLSDISTTDDAAINHSTSSQTSLATTATLLLTTLAVSGSLLTLPFSALTVTAARVIPLSIDKMVYQLDKVTQDRVSAFTTIS